MWSAGYAVEFTGKSMIVLQQRLRNPSFERKYRHRKMKINIMLPHYMQNHIIVMRVSCVPMSFPVGSFDMNFNRPEKFQLIQPDTGMQKIGPLMMIDLSLMNNEKLLLFFRL
jgi:hypothetical protein